MNSQRYGKQLFEALCSAFDPEVIADQDSAPALHQRAVGTKAIPPRRGAARSSLLVRRDQHTLFGYLNSTVAAR